MGNLKKKEPNTERSRSISVSIVNYNGGPYLLDCLASLAKVADEADTQIWVADNASEDGSFEEAKQKFPRLNCIKSEVNLGFGKGQNLILQKIKTEYILILNPDTEVEKGVLSTMLELMEKDPSIGAATCKIVLPDGKVDLTAHRGFPTPWASFLYFLGDSRLYHLTDRDLNTTHEVDAISGSFFLTRKSVLDRVGLFDEDYFMYAEDIDLCYRIKQAGFRVMYVPQVKILHHKGISSGLKKHTQQRSSASLETKRRALDAFYETMKIFYNKHLKDAYPFFVGWLVFLAIDVKWWLAKRRLTV